MIIIIETKQTNLEIWRFRIQIWAQRRAILNEVFAGEISGSHGDEKEDGCLLGCCVVW
jgi:hypothetical protein